MRGALLVLLLTPALAGCLGDDGAGAGAVVGAPAPAFSLVDVDGMAVDLVSLRGQVVLLDLMGVHCPPCRAQMREFLAVWPTLESRNVTFVSVDLGPLIGTLGAGGDGEVREFRDGTCEGCSWSKAGWTFARDAPTGGVGETYGIVALPTLYLIDAEGTLVWKHGGIATRGQLAERIEAALAA